MTDTKRNQVKRAYRRLRVEAGLSQLETEMKARLAKGRFWRLENGIESADDHERVALARVLKCAPSDIPTLTKDAS